MTISAKKPRQMGKRYSSSAVTVNSRVRKAWKMERMSRVMPGPMNLPGALRRRSSAARSSASISRKVMTASPNSSVSPSSTGSRMSISSPFT